MNENDLYARLAADVTEWKRGLKQAEAATSQAAATIDQGMKRAMTGFDGAERGVKRLGRGVNDVRGLLNLFGNSGSEVGRALGGLSSTVMDVADAVSVLGISVTRSPLGIIALTLSAVTAAYFYLRDGVDSTKAAQDAYNSSLDSLKTVAGEGKGSLEDLTKAYKDLTAAQRESERIDILGAIRDQQKVIEAQKQAAGDQVPSFLGNLMMTHTKDMNYPLLAKARDTYGQTGDITQLQNDLYAAGYKDQAFAIGGAKDKAAEAAKQIERLNAQMKVLDGNITPEVKELLGIGDGNKKSAGGGSGSGKDFNDVIDRLSKESAAMQQARAAKAGQIYDATRTVDEKFAQAKAELDALRAEFPELINDDTYQRQLQQLQDGLDKAKSKTDDLSDATKELGLTFQSAFEDAVIEGQNLQSVLAAVAKDIQRYVLRKTVTTPLLNAVDGLFSGSSLSNLFNLGGARATGGPVTGNIPYLVGEKGPEVFVPHVAGAIMPNGSGGGGTNVIVQQSITIQGGVRPDVQAEVARLLPTIKDATVAAVVGARQRGGSVRRAFES